MAIHSGETWGFNKNRHGDNEILEEEDFNVVGLVSDSEMDSIDKWMYDLEVEYMEEFKDMDEFLDWKDELLGRCR